MKKLLSLLLVVLMLVPALALAETYTHPDEPSYSYTPLEGWTVLSKDTADKMLELGGAMIDDPNMSTYVEQAKALNMVYFLSPDRQQVAYTVTQALPGAVDLTAEQMKTLLAPAILGQLQSQFPTSTVENEGEVVTFGDNSFLKLGLSYTVSGIAANITAYILFQGGNMYMISYTQTTKNDDQLAAFEETLASFTAGR